MDSISDLPPVNAVTEHDFANPTPAGSTNGTHPPYSDMIIAAIVGLKDKDGSSRQAIAKYIEKEFANLPPTHSNLLTHHLKRMKNQGELMMVKHSYMLPVPRSVPFQPPTHTMDHPANDTTGLKAESSSVVPRRKPGRPPKPRQDFGYQAPPPAEIQPYQPQFEHQDLQSHYNSGQECEAEPMFASLGLADNDGAAPPPENATKRGRGRPPKGTVKRSIGGDAGDVEAGRRRRPGRPKLMSMVNGGGVKRNVGRPKRIGGLVTVPLSGNVIRPRGRPRRGSRPVGRPAKTPSSDHAFVSKPRGRPPRNAYNLTNSQSFNLPNQGEPGTAVLVTDPEQLVAYQELKFKYQHLQSKAKEVLSVVRPYINPDYSAFGALQELETLVETQANAPINVETENPISYVPNKGFGEDSTSR